MKKNNLYAPDLPEEEINKIAWEFSDDSEDELTYITHQFKEIIEREKQKAFQAGFEKGKKANSLNH